MKQNNELFDKLQFQKNKNIKLTAEISRLNAQIEGFLERIKALEQEVSILKSEQPLNFSDVRSESQPETILDDPDPAQNEETLDFPLSDDFEYGSDVIGNIVIKAAGYINRLSASDNPNKKELINLILGRTEISKAEILNAVLSEVTPENKKALISTQFDEAIEYFESIIEQ